MKLEITQRHNFYKSNFKAFTYKNILKMLNIFKHVDTVSYKIFIQKSLSFLQPSKLQKQNFLTFEASSLYEGISRRLCLRMSVSEDTEEFETVEDDLEVL